MRKIKYQNWIYEILNETSRGTSPAGEEVEKFPPLVGNGGVSLVEPEIEQEVRQAVARLSEKEKIFIEQFYFQGRSYKDISQILKLNLKQAEYLHGKATFKLKNLLTDFVEKKFKIKVRPVSVKKTVNGRKSAPIYRGCLICQNPKLKEIEKVISSKKEEQTWRGILKKLKAKFNLDIKAPQILIGHMKHKI